MRCKQVALHPRRARYGVVAPSRPRTFPWSPLLAEGSAVAQREMMTERMIGIAPIVIAVLAGSFLAALMPGTIWVALTLVITAVVVGWLWWRRRTQHHGHHRR